MEHRIVSRDQWLQERTALLAREKEITRLRDEMSEARRALPWVKVDKSYAFDTPSGKKTLSDLFDGRSQLIVKHFMFGPDWQEGCVGCSFGADQVDGSVVHLVNHDVMFVAVSRAPYPEIAAFHKRMGWHFKWVSSFGSDFNFDYHVSFSKDELAKGKIYYNYDSVEDPAYQNDELPGASVFYKDANGTVFHTYSAYARGLDILVGTYNLLDLTPKGRDEDELPWTMAWVRHHDKYEDSAKSESRCGAEHRKDDAA
jgi:predicted dithiol-disulfide oxidoreductase (DUF899 family)